MAMHCGPWRYIDASDNDRGSGLVTESRQGFPGCKNECPAASEAADNPKCFRIVLRVRIAVVGRINGRIAAHQHGQSVRLSEVNKSICGGNSIGAGDILNHDIGLAGKIFSQVTCHCPTGRIGASAGRGIDDHPDGLALEGSLAMGAYAARFNDSDAD
jgi:hypothetical protein